MVERISDYSLHDIKQVQKPKLLLKKEYRERNMVFDDIPRII